MMKQRLEVLVPLGAIAIVIAISRPWSHFHTIQQLWLQRQQRIAAANTDVRAPTPVQLGRIRGQVVHDINGNGQVDQPVTVIYAENFDAVIPIEGELGQTQIDETNEKAVVTTWSNPQTTEVSQNSRLSDGNRILGLFGGVEDGKQGHTTLMVENLPSHHSVELAVDLWIVDSWDGNIEATFAPDLWQVRQGIDQIVLRTAFSNIDRRADSQSYPLGYPEGQFAPRTNATATYQLRQGSYGDSIYPIQQTFAHNDSQLTLDFSGQGKTALADDERWGLDNLQVTLRSGEVGLSNIIVFLDQNLNGVRDSNEPFTQTDADGNYQFPGLAIGTYRVQVEAQVTQVAQVVDSKDGDGKEVQLSVPYQDIQVLEGQKDHTVIFLGSP